MQNIGTFHLRMRRLGRNLIRSLDALVP
jgi:hypothetical protein